MRFPSLRSNNLTRRQFLRMWTSTLPNSIALEPNMALREVMPYVAYSGFTPTASFYRHITHAVIQVDPDTWWLNVGGLVRKTAAFSLDDLRLMPAVEIPYTLAAVASTPANLLMGHASWRGVSFRQLLEAVGAQPEAQFAQFMSVNGFTTYLPLSLLEHALVAYAMNGETLPAEQGFPVRLIVPGVYDYKMPKWLESVSLVAAPSTGLYESRGWSAEGVVQTTSALFTPRPHDIIKGQVLFSGMAFAGMRTITRIELNIDDGEWMPVPFVPANAGTWTRWQIGWQAPAPGDYLVKVRATDSTGFTQSADAATPIFPNGSSAVHAVVFRVSM